MSVVVIGASLGGVEALQVLLSALPESFKIPVALVQHRRKDPDDLLAKVLQDRCALRVREPDDKEPIRPGHVYVAPADYHLLIEPGLFALSTDEPVNYARPSVDALFESAALAYGSKVVGVVLSGANQDGARGAARIKQAGGIVLVQDPATAEGRAMPEGAEKAAPVDRVLPVPEIAAFLVAHERGDAA